MVTTQWMIFSSIASYLTTGMKYIGLTGHRHRADTDIALSSLETTFTSLVASILTNKGLMISTSLILIKENGANLTALASHHNRGHSIEQCYFQM